jgi:hypothetical protein
MRGIAGFVVDQYDDVRGEVLATRFQTLEAIPDFVKTAHRMTADERSEMPDDAFALVLFDQGNKMKKFAMVDKGNTALSVVYLLEQGHLLPPEAIKTAAVNLLNACEHYGLEIPEKLKEAAKGGSVSSVSGKGQTPYARGAKVIKMQFDSPKESDGNYHDNPVLGKDEEDEDLKSRVNLDSPQGTNFVLIPHFSQKETIKDDHAGSTDNMKQAMVKTAGAFGDAPGVVTTRQKGWREAPHMDISGWDPNQAFANSPTENRETLLHGHYPVDTQEQVKTASAYFADNWQEFRPRDRHTYCVKLAQKLASEGLPISDDIERYGSQTYAADVEEQTNVRRGLVHEEFHSHLDLLLEKRAHIQPETFAEALSDFDHTTNLQYHWGSKVMDPWYTTFGPSLEKVAALHWSYSEMGTRTDEGELKALAMNGHHLVSKSFGAKFADEFAKSPKAFFEALPKPQKLVLARLASDRHSGTGTE